MTRRSLLAAFAALVICAPGMLRAQRAEADPAIDSARTRFLQAFVKKDTALLRERLTDDAITWFKQGGSGSANVGIAAIVTFYGGLFAGALRTEMLFTPETLARDGRAATETGKFTMPGPGISGVYTTLYQRGADGRWRIAFWKAGPAA